MDSTHPSLLNRLLGPPKDRHESWERFVELYGPLLFRWSAQLAVPIDQRNDLVQATLVKLLTSIAMFHRGRTGSFRGWLHTVLHNTWRDSQRRSLRAAETTWQERYSPVHADPAQEISDSEYRQYLLARVQRLVLDDFPERTQMAFRKHVIEERPAKEVADELGISLNSLYLIRSRVVRRIREELAGLVD